MNEKVKDFLKTNVGTLAVALVSLAYIATALITIDKSDKSVVRILADGMVAFLVGFLINCLFNTQGILLGDRDERVQKTIALHNTVVDRIAPYMDSLEDWCEKKNSEALRRARRHYLARYGIRYDDYFEDDGVAKPFAFSESFSSRRARIQELRIYRRYRRAVELQLTRLTPGLLISDGGRQNDPYYMGRSKIEYEKSAVGRDVLKKIATAILFGYYSVSMIQNFDPASLIWMVLQVALFITTGVLTMLQSQAFIVGEYRSRIIKKIDVLELFEISIKKEDGKNGSCQSVKQNDACNDE